MEAPAPPPAPPLLETALHEWHRAHGAHLVPFNGWEMPLYFSGILAEHVAVRTNAGWFDVSHMGIVTVRGPSSGALISRRTTMNAERLERGQVRYTFLLDAAGMIVDDLLVTRSGRADEAGVEFLVVPNAGRAAEVTLLLREHRRPDTEVLRHNPKYAILAVQGPNSRARLEELFGWKLQGLGFYRARRFPANPGGRLPPEGVVGARLPEDLDGAFWVSRTGYTGELGFELLVPASVAPQIADRLTAAGIVPVGLGARDTLRQEKGYLLSGQDFLRDRTPLDAGQERFVDFDHPFVGRPVLDKQKAEGVTVRFAGIRCDEPGAIPRHGTPVKHDGAVVAQLTSGGLSPTLQVGIGLAYLPVSLATAATPVALELRGRTVPAQVVPLPFVAAPPPRRAYTSTNG
jgi:glycine cleavage system T protein (aminomethyltransferase)